MIKIDKDEAPKITLEILDSSGKVIRKYPKKEEPGDEGEEDFFSRGGNAGSLPADAGLNRFVWDLRYEGATKVPHAPLWGGSTDGPEALPGTYQARLTVLGKSYTAPLEIKADPRLKISQEDLPSNSICCSRSATRSRKRTMPSFRFAMFASR